MIKTEKEYDAIVGRMEELLKNPDNIENQDSKEHVELNLLSDLIAGYEERNYPVKKPALVDILKLCMVRDGVESKAVV